MAYSHEILSVRVRPDADDWWAGLEPGGVVGWKVDDIAFSGVLGGVFKGVGNIWYTNDGVISGCNVNDKADSIVRKYRGGGLVKIDTFGLWYPIGTMAGGIVVDVVRDFLDFWGWYGTEYMIIYWETITRGCIREESKTNVFVIFFMGSFDTVGLVWAFYFLTKFGRFHRDSGW